MKNLSRNIQELYPVLSSKSEEMSQTGQLVNFKTGDVMMSIGDDVEGIPFLLDGVAKISVYDSASKQFKGIYEVSPGELCSLVVMNCLTERPAEVQAKCVRDIKTVIVPRHVINKWLSNDQEIRNYLLNEFYVKYNELIRSL